MTRDQIELRIANEKKFRNEGYTNQEIAELMGVQLQTVYRDIGKEPADFREKRRQSRREPVTERIGAANDIKPFPGSYAAKPEPEPEAPATPFARAWQYAENFQKACTSHEKPLSSAMVSEPTRYTKIIADALYKASERWNKVLEGDVLRRQPRIESHTLTFDRNNEPWMVIVYSEVMP